MRYTCADCKYHICSNECTQDTSKCINRCIKKNIKSVCYNSVCADFVYERIKYVANL